MAEFDDARNALRNASAATEALRDNLVAAQEDAKRLIRRRDALHRRSDPDARQELQGVDAALNQARLSIEDIDGRIVQANDAVLQAVAGFAVFTDPAVEIERLNDDTPIALFPLRLETRFRTVGTTPRLLVRAFPDDVLVDSFQPEISEAEFTNTTIYWTHLWRAGMAEEGHRAAWSALVKSHGAGRARWLTQQIAPLNPGEVPPPPTATDHILVVTSSQPVPIGERIEISAFWTRVWASGGNERDPAFARLEAAVGAARAAEVESTLEPVNLGDGSVKPSPAIIVTVAYLELPDQAGFTTSEADWTRGANTWLLPERLVLLGFKDGKQVLRRTGSPIPPRLQVGPDPSSGEAGQIKADGPDLDVPEPLQWTVDFDAAVAKGMAFDVDLTAADVLAPTFDRLFVLGVRIGGDAAVGADELTTLFEHHQRSRKGLELLPQGRGTNNTDVDTAGYSWWEDPAESFDHFFGQHGNALDTTWRGRPDGAWLAGMLGLDPAVLEASPNFFASDQAEARAMNEALWPGTLGYYMEQMMEPVFSPATRAATRDFFSRFVVGRGTVPLIRVGVQPYGILPTTVWSKMAFWEDDAHHSAASDARLPDRDFLAELGMLIGLAAPVWQSFGNGAPHVAEPGADAQQTLLSILGLHPASARFFHRYSQSFTQYYNALGLATEAVSEPFTGAARRYIQAGLLALSELGWTRSRVDPLPEILEKVFLNDPFAIPPPLGAAALSETERLPVDRADGENYLEWLQTAARTSHDTLRKQEGFTSGPPRTLLYQMLRHALDLGYVDTALLLRADAFELSAASQRAERKEPKFLHISAEADSESRWASLYQPEPTITGDQTTLLGEHIPQVLSLIRPHLAVQLDALDRLQGAPTARLERALVEHIDCLSYRLDAWRLGLQAVQLSAMRQETDGGFAKRGIHLGAYGWLEDVKPKGETLTPVGLEGELAGIFSPAGAEPLVTSDQNLGHIHAPSLDQAVTAAILRNGYEAHKDAPGAATLAVDLGSERVRLAHRVIEGIRNGQALGALLGYQLERALHGEADLFLDRLIYDLRTEFPLVGNRNRSTQIAAESITAVEARNVVDGARFADHIAKTNAEVYPYGLAGLPPLSTFTGPGLPSEVAIGALIDGHVAKMRSIGDAVADLATAEGVYQVVRGNADRAAGMLDAVSKGTSPPLPEVSATPRSGRTLTHRLALHLRGAMVPADAASGRPRAMCEPALAEWIAGQMPDPAIVFARVSWHDADGASDGSLTPSMADLGLDAVDLFYLVGSGGAAELPGFDGLLMDFAVRSAAPPRDDAVFSLEYLPTVSPGITLFELASLVRSLRGVVFGARPLAASDLSMQNEASTGDDVDSTVRPDKVQSVRNDLDALRAPAQAFVATLDAATGDAVATEKARDAARDGIDGWLSAFATLARDIEPFGTTSASVTSTIEAKRPRFASLLRLLDEILGRWQRKDTDFNDVMVIYAALPATATDDEREILLRRAGQIVFTGALTPAAPGIAALETEVAARKTAFDTRRTAIQTQRSNAQQIGSSLVTLTNELAAIATVDLTPVDLDAIRGSVLALARELRDRADALDADVAERVAAADTALAAASAASGAKADGLVSQAAHAVLGDGFVVLPEFSLAAERLSEWQSAWTNRAALMTHLMTGPEATPFPVEDWLHGIARVRERVQHIENAVLLGQTLGATNEPLPDPVQFPFRSGEGWLAMEFPEVDGDGAPFELIEDKLLYSPIVGPGADIDTATPGKRYSGLMLDEWVEVIPGVEETTGLAFHFDRPNSEAPQTILLATPPTHRGAWQWHDLVETLHETLDFARLRAVEPSDLDKTALGPLLPAIVAPVTMLPITAMLNFGITTVLATVLEADDE